MKRLILLLSALLALPLSGMAQRTIAYSYDAAGNRTARTSLTEVAVVNESQAAVKTDTAWPCVRQALINKTGVLCDVFGHHHEDMAGGRLFQKHYPVNRPRLVLCSAESPLIIVKDIDIMQNVYEKHKALN